MVSSTVYGIEELLERVYAVLNGFGFEVWMSHKGTVPVVSTRTAFENCIAAVVKCDLFLGIITPWYGSGIDKKASGLSIVHEELRKALELNKPRWILSHDHVIFARSFLRDLGYKTAADRRKLKLNDESRVLGDLRVINMYEEAILSEKPLRFRQGNWVQKFDRDEEALLFASAQFSRYQEVEEFLKENLSNPERVIGRVKRKGGQP